jgi:hypothetical protein
MSAASIEGKAFVLQDLFERWSYDIDYYQREFAGRRMMSAPSSMTS